MNWVRVAVGKSGAWLVMVMLFSALTIGWGADTALGQEDRPTRLPETVVTGVPETGSLTLPTTAESRAELDRVPGGTTVIDQELIHDRAQQSVEEVLSLVPGVYSENADNGPLGRISLRGSGILQSGGFTSGIRVLRDGLPITHAEGHTRIQEVDLLNIHHLEVYKGANALEYGAAMLGGAINFVSPTGYTADRLRVGMRGGSDAYLRPYISSGGVFNNGLDYYVSGSGIDTDGFRRHGGTREWYTGGNVGYRWTENHETRAFFDFVEHRTEFPGPLFQREVEEDPAQATDPRAPGSLQREHFYRGALKHTVRLRERDRLELGASYLLATDAAAELRNIGVIFSPRAEDVAYSLRHELHLPTWGREHRVVWGVSYTSGDDLVRIFFQAPRKGGTGPIGARQDFEGENVEFFLQDHFALTDSFTLVPGLQVTHSKREQRNVVPVPGTSNEDYTGVSPKFGLLWQATEVVQLFGNVSRSFEPPIAGFGPNFVSTDPATGAVVAILDAQRATTLEVGTRGRSGRISWELAAYHAWVEDELLTTQPDPINRPDFFSNSNSDALHSGVELGIEAVQPLGWLASGDQLRARLVYTYNRFRFDDGSRFDDNTLPMIPEHFGNFEVLYEHPLGFYLGLNVAAADNVFVDFANTLKAKSYAIMGARVGYKSRSGFSVFVDMQNLTDEAYTNRVDPIADAGGKDMRQFLPGMTRSVFVGVEWRWL